MNDADHLADELRAAREELVRTERTHPLGEPTPPRDPRFPWLQFLSAEELRDHCSRLERDLRDARTGIDDAGTGADDRTDESPTGTAATRTTQTTFRSYLNTDE